MFFSLSDCTFSEHGFPPLNSTLTVIFFIVLSSHLTHSTHASSNFFCAICMLHVSQSEEDDTDYEMNDSD